MPPAEHWTLHHYAKEGRCELVGEWDEDGRTVGVRLANLHESVGRRLLAQLEKAAALDSSGLELSDDG